MNISNIEAWAESVSHWLKIYNRIFLIKDGMGCYENLTVNFCEFIFLRELEDNILLLSSTLPPCFCSVNAIKIDHLMEAGLIRLFHLYSFSDRFQLLAPSQNQGDIFNFVRTGQISMEEVFLALVK